tara:strand:+ start:695 stop:1639 length:945 start_codon:yes stop_codon:yes gene_type:complete
MKNSIILIFLSLIFFSEKIIANEEIKILYKIENSVVTSVDVENEMNYLVSLNKNLVNYDKKKLYNIASKSLIREKIKKIEIEKFYIMNYEKSSQSQIISNILKNIYQNQGFNNEDEFSNYLIAKDVNIKDVKKKLVIEQHWNKLIYDKYNNSIKIDKKKIDLKLNKLVKENSKLNSFKLSEIIFSEKNKTDYENKYKIILDSIKEIGFKESALIYSISNSSKIGGDIGWINQNQVSEKIFDEIKNLKIGEFSKPIVTPGGAIILLLNDKKEISSMIDKNTELEKIISNEQNRQLNEYSIIYFKQVENKIYVEEM